MSKTVSFGYADSPISGVTSLNFSRGLLNFGADFDVVNDKGSELILTNITTPRDKPEKVRLAYSVVPDVYANSGIAPGAQATSLEAQVS